MAKRHNRLFQSKQDAAPVPPPIPPSPLMQSRMKKAAAHMATPIKPVTAKEAFDSAGFWWVKLFFGFVATIIDFVTNHNFISPNAINAFTVAMAVLLMISEFFLLYAYYVWRENQNAGRSAEATKYLGLFIIFVLATVVDAVATIVPVYNLLMAGGSAQWLAVFMGVLVAVFTSVMQMDFYPTALAMAKSLLGLDK